MRPRMLLLVALLCFALAGAIWAIGTAMAGHGATDDSVWTCPVCGARWKHPPFR